MIVSVKDEAKKWIDSVSSTTCDGRTGWHTCGMTIKLKNGSLEFGVKLRGNFPISWRPELRIQNYLDPFSRSNIGVSVTDGQTDGQNYCSKTPRNKLQDTAHAKGLSMWERHALAIVEGVRIFKISPRRIIIITTTTNIIRPLTNITKARTATRIPWPTHLSIKTKMISTSA